MAVMQPLGGGRPHRRSGRAVIGVGAAIVVAALVELALEWHRLDLRSRGATGGFAGGNPVEVVPLTASVRWADSWPWVLVLILGVTVTAVGVWRRRPQLVAPPA